MENNLNKPMEDFNPFSAISCLLSILTIEILRSFDNLLTHGIQYAIGILTIMYLLKQLKTKPKDK